jgi:hypothetical protein
MSNRITIWRGIRSLPLEMRPDSIDIPEKPITSKQKKALLRYGYHYGENIPSRKKATQILKKFYGNNQRKESI